MITSLGSISFSFIFFHFLSFSFIFFHIGLGRGGYNNVVCWGGGFENFPVLISSCIRGVRKGGPITKWFGNKKGYNNVVCCGGGGTTTMSSVGGGFLNIFQWCRIIFCSCIRGVEKEAQNQSGLGMKKTMVLRPPGG